MPLSASDLIYYLSLNRPEDDIASSGGGIDLDHRAVFTQLDVNGTVEMLSSNAGDTSQNVTIHYRTAAGVKTSEQKTLNGTTVVSFTATMSEILRVVMSADAAGTVTIRKSSGGSTLGTIPPGERGFAILFIDSVSESGSSNRYEKVFLKNVHGTLALISSPTVKLSADPTSHIQMGLAGSKDDTVSVSNRKTAPGSVTFVDDNTTQAIPGGNLGAGEAIGIWIKQTLSSNETPVRSTFTLQADGATT